jgi:hypothetical protein
MVVFSLIQYAAVTDTSRQTIEALFTAVSPFPIALPLISWTPWPATASREHAKLAMALLCWHMTTLTSLYQVLLNNAPLEHLQGKSPFSVYYLPSKTNKLSLIPSVAIPNSYANFAIDPIAPAENPLS